MQCRLGALIDLPFSSDREAWVCRLDLVGVSAWEWRSHGRQTGAIHGDQHPDECDCLALL